MGTFPHKKILRDNLSSSSKKYSCSKYVQSPDGTSRVTQKNFTDCKKLGPVTSGFNEAACDIFHGTWCPTPRDCSALVKCIADATAKVEFSSDRESFKEYLKAAPKVKPDEVRYRCHRKFIWLDEFSIFMPLAAVFVWLE